MTPRYFEAKSQDIYLSTLITTSAELPSMLFTALILKFFKNLKLILAVQFLGSGVFTILLGLEMPDTLLLITALISRMFIVAAFSVTLVITLYLYDTKVRTTGFGVSNAMGRIGGVLTPLVVTVLSPINVWYPLVVYSVACLAAALVTSFIPLIKDDEFR